MPLLNGVSKPAGVRCVQLAEDNRCRLFGRPERPAFCGGLQPAPDMCGSSQAQAMFWLAALERETAPSRQPGLSGRNLA